MGSKTKRVPDMSLIGIVLETGSVIIEYAQTNARNFNKWKLRCKCGSEFYSMYQNFYNPLKPCVCHSCKMKKINLTGQKFGRWLVLQELPYNKQEVIFYNCICDCGTTKAVNYSSLIQGKSKSCGCMNKERMSKLSKLRCGPNHYRWRGGIRKCKNFRKNSCFRYHLRKYILNRDNNQCNLCLSKINLKVHHLDGWNICEKRRYDETNLITLCEQHHKDFHSKFRCGNNTEQQFELFCLYNDISLDRLVDYFVEYKNRNNFDITIRPTLYNIEN